MTSPKSSKRREPYSMEEIRTIVNDRIKHADLGVVEWAKQYPIGIPTFYTFLQRLKIKPADLLTNGPIAKNDLPAEPAKPATPKPRTTIKKKESKMPTVKKPRKKTAPTLAATDLERVVAQRDRWKAIAMKLLDKADPTDLRAIIDMQMSA